MNKIEKLIKELCPGGIEYRLLKELCSITTGKLKTGQKNENGQYPFFTCNMQTFKIDKYAFDTEAIIISGNGVNVGNIKYYDGKFNAEQRTYVLFNFNEISPKFIKYYLLTYFKQYISNKQIKNSAIPYITLPILQNFEIPTPPRAIQDEIVKILDNFTELTTELKYRKQQYEYYRDKLLTFDESKVKVEYKRIDELFKLSRGIVISKDYIRDNPGEYPVYSSQTENNGELGKINTYQYDGEYITWTTDGAHAGTVFYRNGKFNITNICGLLDLKTNDNIKYLYYALSIRTKEHVNIGMGNAKLMSNVMAGIQIPLPPLPVQNRIAEVLDNFEQICHDLKIGLPSEISLRQKQYEYYRDLLLSFNINDIEREREREDNSGLTKLFEYVFGNMFLNSLIRSKTLKELGKFYGGLTGKTKDDFKNGNANFITYMNVFKNPAVNFDLTNKVKILPNDKQRKLEYLDVIFTGSSEIKDEVAMSSVVTQELIGDYYLNSFCFIFRLNNKELFNPNFLKHLFRSTNVRKQLIKTSSGVTRFNVLKKLMENVLIPLPPLQIQNKIVEILDNFSDLTNDLTKGLPAEINLRQKQYEYYRDRLLNFKEVK